MQNDYQYFIEKVKKKTGIDLSLYKEQQMKRRITSLSNKHGYSSLQSFYKGIEKDKELLEIFLNYLTINVTEFYRNRKQWDTLEKTILPNIIQEQGKIKVWSAACSTGEEPYSLGILLTKYLDASKISISATDLDQTILNRAKVGLYSEKALTEIAKDEIARCFTNSGDSYQISSQIKRVITFKKHDLLVDSYPRNYDLIVCRNVLIYFTEEAKDTIIQGFSQSLKKGGILFIGSTERIHNPKHYGLESVSSFFFRKL
ncbi:CheR family methyltransferase [Aquibacillus saliphilus]|uniref:CheR family methyltransferase n=1 Tax=Aquibacillus saliphilus TaxID=1909422 RepID=UPI001CEFEF8A|nr:protein-glutamate O-methyltransferase CheR [Aquibacillus saliphilus]